MAMLSTRQLESDMNALMRLMVNELRKAGYSSSAAGGVNPLQNKFSRANLTALEVIDDMHSNTQAAMAGSGSCVVYSYDLDEDGRVDASELLGFRLNAGVLQMRVSGALADPDTCADASGQLWSNLTDPDFMTVETLTFDLADSECFNIREPDNIDNDVDGIKDEAGEADCYAATPLTASGDITVETRKIGITLQARLANEDLAGVSLIDNVRVDTDWLRSY
jgi:prepilin peptidase dependent protein B